MVKLLIGQDYTLVSKGIRHSDYGKDWVDPTQKGRTSFFKVSKIGTKYLHGTYIYWDQGERQDRDWPAKVIAEDYIIYLGIRQDLKDRYDKYYKAIQEWEKARDEMKRQIHSEWYAYESKRMDEWRQKNPYPTVSLNDPRGLLDGY